MGRFFDKLLPPLIGIICGMLFAKYEIITYDNSVDLIKQFPTIGTCIFGFVLTMFSLIIQGDNEIIKRIKKAGKPFDRFVNFNQKVVVMSLFSTIYSYFIGYFKFGATVSEYMDLLAIIFYSLLIWLAIEVCYFLIIFYILVRCEIKN